MENKKSQTQNESAVQRLIVLIVIIVTILLWLTTPFHGISVAAIAAIPIVVLTLTGIITADDLKNLSWDTLFLVAGGLSLGEALESTGILEHYAGQIGAMKMGSMAIMFVLVYAAMLFANIMSNAGTCTVLIPTWICASSRYGKAGRACDSFRFLHGFISSCSSAIKFYRIQHGSPGAKGFQDRWDFSWNIGAVTGGSMGIICGVSLVADTYRSLPKFNLVELNCHYRQIPKKDCVQLQTNAHQDL